MIEIKSKEKCCGCTACFNVCPQNAVQMLPDEEGFLYPHVDFTRCVECGLCTKVCPELKGFVTHKIKKAFLVRNKDRHVLNNSTSGGAFSALAAPILEAGGAVYGVAFGNNWRIEHQRVCGDQKELERFRGSKYIQSFLGDTFSLVKEDLSQGKTVLFSGTPCQVAGLNNYLSREYKNLITVEVICHGTPSPLLWEKYIEYQTKKYQANPTAISFRNKTYGYHSGTMAISFENGKKYFGSARVDYALKSFFSEISSRRSCYTCMCKGLERAADISVFDAWHAEKLVDSLIDDDRGYTNILINSSKGMNILKLSDLTLFEINPEDAIAMDGIMVCNYPKMHIDREKYYCLLRSAGLKKTIQQLIPVSIKDNMIEKSKIILYKIGIYDFAKTLFKGSKHAK